MPTSDSISCDTLDDLHRDALFHAISNVLATDLALTTYAQIIDGLPVTNVAWDQYSSKIHRRHPVNDHVGLCPGALDRTKEFRVDFDIKSLRFNPALLRAFESAPSPSTRAFGLRLIELTASALHQIAVLLLQLDLCMHDRSTTRGLDIQFVTLWEPGQNPFARVVPDPTLFAHPHFMAQEQYPDGLADVVGYWAENRILGGVVLFDRSQDWEHDKEPNDALLGFLQNPDGKTTTCPLPILPTSNNRERIDPWDAIPVHKVYRDPWEREPPRKRLRMQEFMGRDVISSLDFPEYDVDEELKSLRERFPP
ncbi:uncharacterized protein JN550_000163 [Neoarthrinium moseri]|uniref:uncharacterized protein n=1 Tax=Neoarthrinium moseri TaxID=1658444 RepID=UPI001FDAD946|nr:uncharacterized protein JN550_000163 [Neoarthrinium moseri]KAI1877981.1 hypothetical protein JN550_000163 [Neoarthrinium moseri]